jgi:hypothetical protein
MATVLQWSNGNILRVGHNMLEGHTLLGKSGNAFDFLDSLWPRFETLSCRKEIEFQHVHSLWPAWKAVLWKSRKNRPDLFLGLEQIGLSPFLHTMVSRLIEEVT